MRRVFLVLIALFACFQAKGQFFVSDETIVRDFNSRVKSIEEFVGRFNGTESKPGLDESSRKDNLLSLFDFQMSRNGLDEAAFSQLIERFVTHVIETDSKLGITSAQTVAEIKCSVTYAKKNHTITMFLQREPIASDRDRWAVIGVKGLSRMGIYDDKRVTISPVDHEVYFLSLSDLFNENRKLIPGIRSINNKIDELSLLIGLTVSGSVRFNQVEDLSYHFLGIPDYVITVNEINREGTNSGWLITEILELNVDEKIDYLTALL